MSPEATTSTQERAASGQIVKLPNPGRGDAVAIASSPGGVIELPFDPSTATTSREGNNLVFETEGGGKVTITDFFIVGDESLPSLRLPGGEEVSSDEFFAGSDLDMSTEAGPAAAASVPGGGTNYNDDDGSLLGGIDRLGMLGTDYWGRDTEPDLDARGLDLPGGDFSFGIITESPDADGYFTLVQGVFEDGQPWQHQGDTTRQPGQVQMVITPNPVSNATEVTFNLGADNGRGQFGTLDENGNFVPATQNANGDYIFTAAQVNAGQVYFMPAEDNNDTDINVSVSVTFVTNSGTSATVGPVPQIIVVDAVADYTTVDNAYADADESGHVLGSVDVTTEEAAYNKGFVVQEQATTVVEGTGEGKAVITVTITGAFGDYQDGSETHSLLVEVKPGMVLDESSLPEGYTLLGQIPALDADGNPMLNADGAPMLFYKIQVDNEVIQNATPAGTVELDITIETSGVSEDTEYTWKVGAIAEESNISDSEPNWDNNTSRMVSGGEGADDPAALVDVVNSRLTVRVGWASEGNENDKHVSGDYTPDFNTMDGDADASTQDVDPASTAAGGAPIFISIAGAENSAEFITSVTLDFGQAEGALVWADPLPDGYTVTDNRDGSYTITVSADIDATDLDALGLHFQPSSGSTSDQDVIMSFEVTVENGEGATAHYDGRAEIVIDAVADRSLDIAAVVDPVQTGIVDTDFVQDGTPDKTTGWETDTLTTTGVETTYTTSVTVSTSFPDYDGSENHYLLVLLEGDNAGEWKVAESGEGTFVSGGASYSYTVETINGLDYIKVDVTDAVNGSTDGVISIDLPLQTTNSNTGDETLTIKTGSLSEEQVGTGDYLDEHDAANNAAIREDGETVTHTIDRVESGLTVKAGWASEGNSDAKHLGIGAGKNNTYTKATVDGFDRASTGVEKGINTGAPINLSLSGDVSGEFIYSFTLTENGDGGLYLTDGNGNLTEITDGSTLTASNGSEYLVTVSPDGAYTFTLQSGSGVTGTNEFGTSGIVYAPKAGSFDYSDVNLDYEVTVRNNSAAGAPGEDYTGPEATFKGASTIVIDAVADKPGVSIATDGSQVDYPTDPADPGSEYTTAKPGDTVDVHGTVSFPDASGGETHSFTFQALNNGTVNSGTLTVTVVNSDGGTSTLTYLITKTDTGYSYTVEETGETGDLTQSGAKYTVPLPDASSQVDSDFNITLSDTSTKNGGLTITGTAAVNGGDGDGSAGDYEYDTVNNTATTSGTITVAVDGTLAAPKASIGSAYENAAKWASEGEYRPESDDAFWKNIETADRQDVVLTNLSAGDQDKLDELKGYSAKITLDKAAAGEFISGMKVAFEAHDPADPAATGQFMVGDTLVPVDTDGVITVNYNGMRLLLQCEVIDGKVILTLLADTANGDDANLTDIPLYYVPGTDSSHEDVDFDLAIAVTNESNDYTRIFDNDGQTSRSDLADALASDLQSNGIIPQDPNDGPSYISPNTTGAIGGTDHTAEIDAVAAKPEFDVIDSVKGEKIDENNHNAIKADGGEQSDGYYDYVVPGSVVTIPLTGINLHGDTLDGSEHHHLMVEAVDGYTILSVTLLLAGGTEITINPEQSSFQGWDSDTYLSFDLESALAAYNKANNTDFTTGDIANIDISVQTPSGASGSGTITVGITTSEDRDIVTSGDKELTQDNNLAESLQKIEIPYSKATAPTLSVGGSAYENSTPDANEGDYTHMSGVVINLGFGDNTDELKDFNLSLDTEDGSSGLGSFWLFKSNEAYNDYLDAIKDGTDPYEALQKYATEMDSITFNDIKDQIGVNENGQLTGDFDGKIIYMPGEDTDSGKDPNFKYTITVQDTLSGQISETGAQQASITTDTVAQQPGEAHSQSGVDATLGGGPIETTIEATFYDSDANSAHFILVEAEPGWTVKYSDGEGGWVELTLSEAEVFVVDGVAYYKIPVSPEFTGNEGTAGVTVQLTPPANPLYWHILTGEAEGNAKSYEIKTGTLTIDSVTGEGGELTYHNNVAIDESGGITGDLDRGTGDGDGKGTVEQTKPLYEDNQPNQHVGDNNTEVHGEFLLSCPGAETVEFTVPIEDGQPSLIVYGADGQPLMPSASGTYTITLTDGAVTISVGINPAYPGSANSDADLAISDVIFKNGNNTQVGDTVTSLEVIVDAVADNTAISTSVITTRENADDIGGVNADNITADAVAATTGSSGADSVARITVNAEFTDTDGSEQHFIVVEKAPSWELNPDGDGCTIYIDGVGHDLPVTEVYIDGKMYYQINVTGHEGSEYTIGMTYVGMTRSPDADITADGSQDGVRDFHFEVGAMTREANLSGQEVEVSNNTSLSTEKVTVQYSPIDSTGAVDVTASAMEGDDISLQFTGIATDAQDVLDTMTVTITIAGGEAGGALYIADGNGNSHELTSDDGINYTITAPAGSGLTDDEVMNGLSDGSLKLTYEPSDHNHQDITITWEGEVHDKVSGATGSISGARTVIVDAKADGADITVAEDQYGYNASVQDGKAAVITITADFADNVNDSEEHYVVIEQKDLDYTIQEVTLTPLDGGESITLTLGSADWDTYMTVKFDADRNPYWAVKMPDQQDYEVSFTVKTPSGYTQDTDFTLKGGVITVETTLDTDANHEPTYSNNWTADLEDLTIHTGVVETKADEIIVTGAGNEDNHIPLTFPELNSDYNEHLEITLTADSLPEGSGIYVKDGEDWVLVEADNNGKYVLDGSKSYAYKPVQNMSGTVEIGYEATVTDNASGAEESYTGKTAVITVTGVPDAPTEVNLGMGDFTSTGDAYILPVSVTFPDTTGEAHYIVLSAVVGLIPDGFTLTTLGNDNAYGLVAGDYYILNVDGATGDYSADISFTATSGYTGGEFAVYGVATEGEGDAATSASVQAGSGVEIDPAGFTHYTVTEGVPFDGSLATHGLDITGSPGADAITGSAYNDVIHGNAGNDHIYGTEGSDTIYGGEGNDTLDYSSLTGGGITLDLTSGIVNFDGQGDSHWTDSISGFESYVGTDHSDTFILDGSGAGLSGGGGSDIFFWGGGMAQSGSHTIVDFEFNYTWNNNTLQSVESASNDSIKLDIGQMLGGGQTLDTLLESLTFTGNTASYNSDSGSFNATFMSTSELSISLNANGETQTIDVNLNTGNTFTDNLANLDVDQVAQILQQILKTTG